ncbi:transposase, partial [Corynebacterium diphtheriae]|uniref:transposase n=2 Tax=Corynebacterium diphtheriae TaxID=1717 RepID=UPI000B755D40
HHYNRPRPTTNKQAANKTMSTLIDTLVGMKDARIAEIAQLGRTMNKRCKDIFAYFDRYILWCLIHAANIRHTINAL